MSRNPLYFFTTLALFGLSIASASWVMLLLVILYNIFQHVIILGEERFCLEKYGEAYLEYKNSVPRYLVIIQRKKLKSSKKCLTRFFLKNLKNNIV